nr:DUF262 domain-containing protein [Mycoplasma phocoeninasale]
MDDIKINICKINDISHNDFVLDVITSPLPFENITIDHLELKPIEKKSKFLFSGCYSVNELIETFRKYMVILPVYQRDYVWDKEQIQSLLENLYNDFNNNNFSYLNNIIFSVLKNTLEEDDPYVFEMVDGQQRIMTIILLLLAITKYIAISSKKIPSEMHELFYDEQRNIFNIFYNLGDVESYKELESIINGKFNIDSHTVSPRIERALEWILEFLVEIENKDKRNNETILNFYNHIFNNTFLTFTKIHNKKGDQIFQALNQNVKALNSLDLLRNYFYGKIADKVDENDKLIKKLKVEFLDYFIKKNKQVFNPKLLETFTVTYYCRLMDSYPPKKENLTKDMHIYNLLVNIVEKLAEINNNDFEKVLKELIHAKEKFNYILEANKQKNFNYPISENEAISAQILACTFKQTNSVFIPLI